MESLGNLLAALGTLDGASLLACYVGLHVACAVLCLPCSPFTFIAGSLWGLWPGLPISSGSALLAAGVTFAIGRSAPGRFGGRVLARLPFVRRAAGIAAKILGMGWQSVVLVQGNPLVPASSVGYVFGLTGIAPRTFLVATYLATLPLQAVLVATGAMAHDAIVLRQVRGMVVFSMIVATALLGVRILVRRRLQRSPVAAGLLSEGKGDAK
jgi:uncharacterized membrane protein YdjX (TVP38/TMEM64 family)